VTWIGATVAAGPALSLAPVGMVDRDVIDAAFAAAAVGTGLRIGSMGHGTLPGLVRRDPVPRRFSQACILTHRPYHPLKRGYAPDTPFSVDAPDPHR
jgi:hypothetical protein